MNLDAYRGRDRLSAAHLWATPMTDSYAHYHGPLLQLARSAIADNAWKPKLREILATFDEECAQLPPPCRRALCDTLAGQVEQELLRFHDPVKEAVLALAIKHFDSVD
jgi:hypothetical protein